ncbi:MAG: sigma-54 dependent transcriptional regulator [Bacteroidetes bacterium]|nr:sigma-54 dependent transcriptional regulator [Bacteroidota bacterium]
MVTSDKLQDIKNRFEIVGNSHLLNTALETAIKVAPTDMNVLVIGESGVGKENFSKIIHHLSKRKHNNFIAINCGAIPAGTIDSELFGHEKGAFTSAHDARKGYFETVDGGTIFLDEIGELPLETQSRLLRVLESGEYIKVGASKVLKTDVRIVAATNRDLLEQTQKGKFREDLYYRLCTVTIKIPALRERAEDVPYLWAKFANDLSDRYKVPPVELTPDATYLAMQFKWPGNIRQLKNTVEQVSVLETDRIIQPQTLAKYLPEAPGNFLALTAETGHNPNNINERELIFKFLFEIKKDISDLKALMGSLINGGLQNMPPQTSHLPAKILGSPQDNKPIAYVPEAPFYNNEITYETKDISNEQETFSLITKEKELIEKALAKYKGKRKLAAQELGISERTLYRKIKDYNLEEE